MNHQPTGLQATTEDYLFLQGRRDAPFLVLTEPPDEDAYERGFALTPQERRFFRTVVESYGLDIGDFAFLPCAAPMPEECTGDREQGAHLEQDHAEFHRILATCQPRLILPCGRHALRQLTGRAVQISKARGKLADPYNGTPVLPMWGIRQCLWYPENIDLFTTDFNIASMLEASDFDPHVLEAATEANTDYQWCDDLSEYIRNPPRWAAIDTETTGLDYNDPRVRVLTVQFTFKVGMARVVPIDPEAARIVWPDLSEKDATRLCRKLRSQVQAIAENPRIKKCLSNGKFDFHMLRNRQGITIKGWEAETQQLAFLADDNMREKGLDEVTRRWTPQMAGYADAFNATVDKSRMLDVLRENPTMFLRYAGGDTDACYRNCRTLLIQGHQDEAQWQAYRAVQLPMLQAFADRVEPTGLVIDRDALGQLQERIEAETAEVHTRCLSEIPADIRRRHLLRGLSLTRRDLIQDALFSDEGLGLEPVVFTKGTQRKAPEFRIPSTSGKQHLIYFASDPLVDGIMRWGKLDKMRTTYVGKEHDPEKNQPTGFWQHLRRDGDLWRVYPSFHLHRTSTGRSASSNPNAQNFPKRGELAKAFRSIFAAPPGYTIIEADLSQAELRIAAVEANERRMIRLYNEGVDIHANTGALVSGNELAKVLANKRSDALLMDVANDWAGSGTFLQKMNPGARRTATVADFIAQIRFQAKAVNFGFLYGMQWRGFKTYAKVEYGIDYSDADCQRIRADFFEEYPGLQDWHYARGREVHETGMVRSLHGAIRRLPSIYSTKKSVQAEAVRQAINSPVQRFASDLGLMALWRICRDAPRDTILPVAFIHDALVFYVRDDVVPEACSAIKFYMENNPLQEWFGLELPLPIVADVSTGKTLGDMHEQGGVVACPPAWWNQEADRAPPLYLPLAA